MYADLPPRDRREVDAWRSLGNDMVASLLNSGVLSRRDGAGAAPSCVPREWERFKTEEEFHLRLTAEHEAAHAVVARALGVPVVEVLIRDDFSGETRHEPAGRAETATIAAAADVWISGFRSLAFPGQSRSGCQDDALKLARNTDGPGDAQLAVRRAGRLLRERQAEVLALADELVRRRRITFEVECPDGQ
ncbi:hypothetical protein [Streptomyces goshikiensis]|uniref:hypothetical protein n=1 Tax=Streptomyces goshikiensis TaxID=1942 RepID=UPI0036A68B90